MSSINMMLFSDLHCSESTKKDDLIKIKQAVCKPDIDYVFFAGDLIDSNEFVRLNSKKREELLKWLEDIAREKRLIMINGNHDLMSKESNGWKKDFCNKFWAEVNSIRNLYYSSDNYQYIDNLVSVCGLNLPFEYYENATHREDEDIFIYYLSDLLSKVSDARDRYRILLSHSPVYVTSERAREYIKNFDLVLSGHMHNGVMPPFLDKLIPGNRGLISPTSQLFPDNSRGVKSISFDDCQASEKRDNCSQLTTSLVISGGITKISDNSKIHFLNRAFPMEVDDISCDMETGKVNVKRLSL